jgi:hypothetical protein
MSFNSEGIPAIGGSASESFPILAFALRQMLHLSRTKTDEAHHSRFGFCENFNA